MRPRTRASRLAPLLALGLAGPAAADTVTLKNGRELHGKLVEETPDALRIRTAGGTITVAKADVATFVENDLVEPYLEKPADAPPPAPGPAPARGPAPAAPADGEGGGQGGAQGGGDAPAPASGETPTRETWTWAEGLDRATIGKLTPVRDRLLDALVDLPTEAERLKKVELDAGEREELQQLMEAFDRRSSHVRQNRPGATRRTRGVNSRNQARRAAANDVAEYGALAIAPLKDKLGSANDLDRRMSAQTLGKLKPDDDFKAAELAWYHRHFETIGALIGLLSAASDAQSFLVRNDANEALKVITGQDGFGFTLGKGKDPSDAELEAARQWQVWWTAEKARWKKQQEDDAKKREAVLAALEEVRQGKEPATDPLRPPPAPRGRR